MSKLKNLLNKLIGEKNNADKENSCCDMNLIIEEEDSKQNKKNNIQDKEDKDNS